MRSWIVCGWFTPDYRKHWEALRENLDRIGAPHDFVEVGKLEGGWEANVSRKAVHSLKAMDRHPSKTIILLDVDCLVLGGIEGLDELSAISGDVAFHFTARWNNNRSSHLVRYGPRSGTMVFKPTEAARGFVRAWIEESQRAPRYATSQDSLAVVLGRGISSVSLLDARFCARPKDGVSDPVILHDAASRTADKVGRFKRFMSGFSGRYPHPRGNSGADLADAIGLSKT